MSRAQLKKKYENNQSLKKQAIVAQNNYQMLFQRSFYIDLPASDCNFIIKYNGKNRMESDIYFIDAFQQRAKAKNLDKLSLAFIKCIPKPTKNYSIVYFNDQDNTNQFTNLKTVLEIMPIQYFLNLVAIFLVKPTFFQKAGRFFVFGTIPKFINSVTEYAKDLNQLSQQIVISPQQIIKYIPKNYFQEHEQIKKLHTKEQQYTKQYYSIKNQPKQNLIKKKRLEIDQYPKAENGLPEIFQILVYYFQAHPQGLKIQGIFRKSANIQQQNQIKQQIAKKHYHCIDQIDNPHLIANLIKQFLGNLLTPIIPYEIFYQLMDQPNLTVQFVSIKMKELSHTNLTKLLTLMFLLEFLCESVIIESQHNKMNTQNIAICFAPCIMWAQKRTEKQLIYATKSILVLKIMLKNFKQVFGSPQDQRKLYRQSYIHHKNIAIQNLLKPITPKQVESALQKDSVRKRTSQLVYQDEIQEINYNSSNIVHSFSKKAQFQNTLISDHKNVQYSNISSSKNQLNNQNNIIHSPRKIKKGIFTSKMLNNVQQQYKIQSQEKGPSCFKRTTTK